MLQEHEAKKVAKKYQESLVRWQGQGDDYAEMLDTAGTFDAVHSAEVTYEAGEAVFFGFTRASLVEDRRGAGRHQDGSTRSVDPGWQHRWPVGPVPGGRLTRPLPAGDADHLHRDGPRDELAGGLPGQQVDPKLLLRQAHRLRLRRRGGLDDVLGLQPPEAYDRPLRLGALGLVRLPPGPLPGIGGGHDRSPERRSLTSTAPGLVAPTG